MYTGQVRVGVYGLGAYNPGYTDSSQAYAAGQLLFTGGNMPMTQTVAGLAEGTQLILTEANLGFTISNATVHLFTPPDTSAPHAIKNKHSGLFLHWNGTSVVQSASISGSDAQWQFVATGSTAADGITPTYKIKSTLVSGGLLGIESASTSAQAALVVSAQSDASQAWVVKPAVLGPLGGDTSFELVNLNPNMVAEPAVAYQWSGGTDPSASVASIWQTGLVAGENEQWILQ